MSTNLDGLNPRRDARRSFQAGEFPAASEHADSERTELLFAYGMFFARSKGQRMPDWASTCARGACAGVVAVATAKTLAEVDLTPNPSWGEIDGVRFANVTFRSGQGRITYIPPRGWKLLGGRGRLTLHSPDAAKAEASITVEMNHAPAVYLDETGIQEKVDALTKRLPREATCIEVLAAAADSLRIDGCDALSVALRYHFFGQTFRNQVILVPVDSKLWRLEFTSLNHQFDRAYEPFRQSLYSLEGIARIGRLTL
jgi:hypothetical protein